MAILTDALGLEPTWHLAGLFNVDFLAFGAEEIWIRRSTVLRWTRGHFADLGVADLPKVLENLPPVEREGYQRKPTELAWERRVKGSQSIDSLLGRE